MFMHLKSKDIAFLSIMAAFSVVLMYLGCLIEVNTLFFMAAASFLVGVAAQEHGFFAGAVFFAVCLFLSFLLLPNKLYCLTYAALGIYIWAGDFCMVRWSVKHKQAMRGLPYLFMKLFIFNLLFIPFLIFFPQLIFGTAFGRQWMVWMALAAQPALVIFDYAYVWFQSHVWKEIGRRMP